MIDSTDIDGNREGLIDGESGFLLPPFDTGGLVRSLGVLLGDPDLREKMGTAGRAFALARFDSNVMVEALEKVYRTAARGHG